jgi:uncharacterized protein (TIGR03437 family)
MAGLWNRLALLGAAVLIPAGPPAAAGDRPRLEDGILRVGTQALLIRGVNYSNAAIGERGGTVYTGQPCRFARDLPLIAAMGANTVRTRALIPERDSTFVSVLETADLYWIADFPLDPYYDPTRSILSRREEILSAFGAYAARFHSTRRLIGYVFGNEVLEGYNRKFAGPPTEFLQLLSEAAEILRRVLPQDTPLLATAIRDPENLRGAPPGLSFWALNAPGNRDFSSVLQTARSLARLPILVSEFGIDAFDRRSGQEDEEAQTAAAAAIARQIEATPGVLGGLYLSFLDEWWREGLDPSRHVAGITPDPSFPDGYRNDAWAGIFRVAATEQAGLDSLAPRAVFAALASLWRGTAPPGPPSVRIDEIAHAASGGAVTSPAALVRVTGSDLSAPVTGAEWGLHARTSCFCIGGLPARLGAVSPETVIALTPAPLQPGVHKAVFYRWGAASNYQEVRVQDYAPGIFPGAVLRPATDCRVSQSNGARPGDVLEVYLTGLGSGPYDTVEVEVNGLKAEILYAGTLEAYPGVNQINVRVPRLAPRGPGSLIVRASGHSSNSYPLSIADEMDVPGIELAVSGGEIVLQAGGPPQTISVAVEGRNGYCGPVLFRSPDLPEGIVLRSAVAFTGHAASLELRALEGARPTESGSLTVLGTAPGAATGRVPLRFAVLPSRGDIRIRVVSGGYKAGPLALFEWAGRTLFSTTGGGPGRGINVLAVDPASGVFSQVQSFDTWGDPGAAARLRAYLGQLAPGTIALFAIADEGTYQLDSAARETIRTLFGSRLIGALGYQDSWAMIGRKGAGSPLDESAATDKQVRIERVLTLPAP